MAGSTEKLPVDSMTVMPMDYQSSQMDLGQSTTEKSPLLPPLSEPEEYYNFGHHIKSDYRETFIEPRHLEETPVGRIMAPWIKGIASVTFENVQASLYYGLSFLLGIILSVVWGIVFAVNSFVIVWLYQPNIKITFMWLRMVSVLYKAATRMALDPVFESCGKIFSFISGKFTFTMRGLPDRASITEL